MKKIIFIIPYFGKFNNYFQLFLNSCAKNPDFNWLIFTDDKREFKYPKNVKVVYMCFDDFVKRVQDKFVFKIRLDDPHKLCDFKPCYGYIFGDYISNYEYWGYCDCDLIFGNLSKYINDDVLGSCDKFGVLGHLSLIKNTLENNRIFMKGRSYKEVLTKSKICTFDEVFNGSINSIFRDCGKRMVPFVDFADIHTKSSNFKLTHFSGETLYDFKVEKQNRSIFIWNDGTLERLVDDGGKIRREEYAYIHLQKRRMGVKIFQNTNVYKIIPNAFEPLEVGPDAISSLKNIKVYNPNLHYLRLRSKNLKNKIVGRN